MFFFFLFHYENGTVRVRAHIYFNDFYINDYGMTTAHEDFKIELNLAAKDEEREGETAREEQIHWKTSFFIHYNLLAN